MRTNSFAEILTTDLALDRAPERVSSRNAGVWAVGDELGQPARGQVASAVCSAPAAGESASSFAALAGELAADRKAEDLLFVLLALAGVAALAGNVLETVDWLHRWADFEALVKNCF